MSQRQTVEFLRRRYAAAILRHDADTAGRLRAQLDGIMNPGAGRDRAARQPEACPGEAPAEPLSRAAGSTPRLCLVQPVTGLLEGPRGRREP